MGSVDSDPRASEGAQRPLSKIAVIGAGVMGTGVAHLLAETGHEVTLVDVEPQVVERAREKIRKNLRMYRLFGARLHASAEEETQVLARIRGSINVSDAASADMIIENITEKWGLKKEVHLQLSSAKAAGVPVAVNTSAIPMARFAEIHDEPGTIVGMHFMNPVPVMPVVEVIRGQSTSESTLGSARRLAEQMGRQSIVVNDSPGFVTNRVMMLMVNEAIFLLDEGVSTADEIDRLFQSCFNHRMGPLATADLIGLDTVLYSIDVLHQEFADEKYRPCPLLRKMVDKGLLGRKSGRGFHRYDDV